MSESVGAAPASAENPAATPLNLPVGSVRALITLAILGAVWAQLLRGIPTSEILRNTLLLVLGYYFGARNAVPPAANRFASVAGDRESNPADPLYLPRGSIRVLIMVGFGAVGLHLWQSGKLSPGNPPPEMILVGTFLAGNITRGVGARLAIRAASRATRFLGHLLAFATLLIVFGFCAASALGVERIATPEYVALFVGIVGFYLGRR